RCYTPAGLEPLARLVNGLGELIGDQPVAPAVVGTGLRGHLRLLGTDGLAGHALAGLDMALWDALAQSCRLPLVTLLGGAPRPIPCYASLRTMAPSGAAAEAERAAERGFRAVKLKLGKGDLDADVAAIAGVRGAVGDSVEVMVDYNQSLT